MLSFLSIFCPFQFHSNNIQSPHFLFIFSYFHFLYTYFLFFSHVFIWRPNKTSGPLPSRSSVNSWMAYVSNSLVKFYIVSQINYWEKKKVTQNIVSNFQNLYIINQTSLLKLMLSKIMYKLLEKKVNWVEFTQYFIQLNIFGLKPIKPKSKPPSKLRNSVISTTFPLFITRDSKNRRFLRSHVSAYKFTQSKFKIFKLHVSAY